MSNTSRQSSTPLRGVVVGAGYFSAHHLDAWSRIPEVEIVAIADLSEEKARSAAGKFGIPGVYVDYREMLAGERPQFVDVVTGPAAHFEICSHAAWEGVHVICQKPLSPTFAEAERLVRNVEEAGVRFMVHENWRWQPWYREVTRLKDAGVLGEISSISFRMRTGDGWAKDAYLDRQPYFRDYPRLLIFETGVHFIDTFRFLLGAVRSVYARLRRLNPEIAGEDAGHVVLGFESGATAVLDANRYNEPHSDAPPRYTFGTMRVDAGRASLELDPFGAMTIKPLGRPVYRHEYAHVDRGLAGDSVFHLQRHFVTSFLHDEPFESSGEDYLTTLRVVEACYDSHRHGEVVHIQDEDRILFTPSSGKGHEDV